MGIDKEINTINEKVRKLLLTEYSPLLEEYYNKLISLNLPKWEKVIFVIKSSMDLIKSEEFSCLSYYQEVYKIIDTVKNSFLELEELAKENENIKQIIQTYNEFKILLDKLWKIILQKINMEIARINKMQIQQEESQEQENADDVLENFE